jgi:glucose-6-phosphate 1-dehydrogenase
MPKATVSCVSPPKVISEEPQANPFGLVIFGASGDLTKRKLIPAFFRMMQAGQLPDRWYVVGSGRTQMDDEGFRKIVKESLQSFKKTGSISAAVWEKFSKRFHYLAGDSQDAKYHVHLRKRLIQLDKEHRTGGNRLFYLATPPDLYSGVIRRLGEAGLNRPGKGARWSRVVIEKPFGKDLASAQSLNRKVAQVFKESQVYRIDHYLGKETVQNILFFRFANAIFEPIWNRQYIDHIQITVAEDIGIEHRSGYYEGSGALRDMFQNHLLQLFCLVAMEPPANFEADAVRDERVKVLKSVRPVPPEKIDQFAVRGQYGPGIVGGQPVAGYRGERGVKPDSSTETYAALKLHIDSWRWKGVRFYLRSGKRLAKRTAEIAVEFKWVPHLLFTPLISEDIHPNTLVFRIQPDEGICLTFQSKHPGPRLCMDTVTMDFNYRGSFKSVSPEAYERLLLDCLIGDQMLFARRDWVELSWSIINPILRQWEEAPDPRFPNYEAGSHGPDEGDELIDQDDRHWREI